ncbi:hypothetical protein HDK77DRAFT_511474 [Phyllosticta capitalensis]
MSYSRHPLDPDLLQSKSGPIGQNSQQDPLAVLKNPKDPQTEQVSKEVDAMFKNPRARCEENNLDLLDNLTENIRVVKEEGIVITDLELLSIDNQLSSSRSKVEYHKTAHQIEMNKLVLEMAKMQNNTAFLTCGIAGRLCSSLQFVKPDRNRAMRTAEERRKTICELENEAKKLRADLKKQTDLLQDLTKKHDKMKAVFDSHFG